MNDKSKITELLSNLQYDKREFKLFIPNEIFNDLLNSKIKSIHIPFTYSYYYLISWCYRYGKYGNINIENKMLKKVLGYSQTNPDVDYIIKNKGILDSIEYTSTVKDYPVSWTYDEDELDFTMISDFDEDTQKYIKQSRSRKYAIKLPIKAFHRYENDTVLDGTFYEVDNTHLVSFEVFLFSMSKNNIGCVGFYIWSYLKMKNQIFTDGYDISLSDLANEIGMARSTLCGYVDQLRKHRMINVYYNQEYFCLALKEDDRNANTYVTNDWELFSNNPIQYEKIKNLSVKDYYELEKVKEHMGEIQW